MVGLIAPYTGVAVMVDEGQAGFYEERGYRRREANASNLGRTAPARVPGPGATVAELRSWCAANRIDVPRRARKADIISLIEQGA